MGEFVQELFSFNLYKRSQGKIARQVTFGALAVIIVLAAYCLNHYYTGHYLVVAPSGETPIASNAYIGRYVVPISVLVLGLWISFRAVHLPSFADFLISVEAEMNKVAWPARGELVRASIVVILMIFTLAVILFAYDFVWKTLFRWLLGP